MTEHDGLLVKIYGDLLSGSVQRVGGALSSAVKVALSPANLLLWTFEQAAEYAESRVHEILQRRGVTADRIITPKVEIAGPAISALRITAQDESIRQLYLNLLASAMDAATADGTHPGFVEIVKSLNPSEAKTISVFAASNAIGSPVRFPLIELVAVLEDGGEVQVLSRLTNVGTRAGCSTDLPASSIDNLVRLGLAAVHLEFRMQDPAEYDELVNHPWIADMREIAESRSGCRTEIRRGVLEVTQFGFDFAYACTGGIECVGLNPIAFCSAFRIPWRP
jgi:hypothetical protein